MIRRRRPGPILRDQRAAADAPPVAQGILFGRPAPTGPPGALVAGRTLEAARAEVGRLLAPRPPGEPQPAGSCPACGRRVQLYRRRLNATLGRALAVLADLDRDAPGAWHDYRAIRARAATDFTLLRHWRLLEADPQGGARWRITARGLAFVGGHTVEAAAVFLFDDALRGLDAGRVTFAEVLGGPARDVAAVVAGRAG